MNAREIISGCIGGGYTAYIAYLFFASFSQLRKSKKSLLWLVPMIEVVVIGSFRCRFESWYCIGSFRMPGL